MASVMALVGKKQFEQLGGDAKCGVVLPIDRYNSAHQGLKSLASGGSLFCVTARSDDRLWLVGILEQPTFRRDHWKATESQTPITDVTSLISKLRFSTGKGLALKPGKLGMSLQTPRVLTDEDVELLRAAASGKARSPAKSTRPQELPVKQSSD